MNVARVGFTLILGLFCFCVHAPSQEQNMIVTGVLTHIMAIGGESTGWQIQLSSEIRIGGKPVETVEIDFRDSKVLERLQNKRVKAAGKLSRRTGVETGIRSVLVVSSIEEVEEVAPSPASRDLTPLFSHIWQITNAPSKPAHGNIYVFMANGTLLQTSCVETYRIARWSTDNHDFSALRVVEDGRVAFTASIMELTSQTLKLRKKLAHSNGTQEITLRAVEGEFVCPDLPK